MPFRPHSARHLECGFPKQQQSRKNKIITNLIEQESIVLLQARCGLMFKFGQVFFLF